MNTTQKKNLQTWCMPLSVLLLGVSLLLPGVAQAATASCTPWVAGVYTVNSPCVAYQGQNYKAQWWTDVAPYVVAGGQKWDSPWIIVSDPGPTPEPTLPGVPQISAPTAGSTFQANDKIAFNWAMSGTVGTSWEVFANTTSLYKSTSFATSGPTAQTGTTNLALATAGNYNLTVKLCNTKGCSTSAPVAVTVKGSDPTPAKDVPGAARVNWMNATAPSGQAIAFAWTLDWGVTATSWEVMANNTSVYTSTTFASTTANSQTGNTSLKLADGKYNLAVKLCNAAGCTTGTAFPITVGADQAKTPTAPQLSEVGNLNRGQAVPVTWNMYWGDIGSSWEVLIDTKSVYTSQQFSKNEANAQAGQTSIDVTALKLTDGKHTLVAKLCNGSLCSQDSKTFTVGGDLPPPPVPAPGKPVVASIPDSTTKQVTLKWSLAAGTDVKGASWSVLDNFKGTTTTVFPSSTIFGADGDKQTGTAGLTLDNGIHQLTVRLCNTASVCTDSAVASAKVTLPPQPAPGTAVMAFIPDSTTGKLAINWAMTGTPGAYWEVWNGSTRMQRFTTFTKQEANAQAGTATLSVNNGTYTIKVKLCNSDDVCSDSNGQTVNVSGAADKKHFFVAYYPTWFAPYYKTFCEANNTYYDYATKTWKTCVAGNVLPDNTIQSASLLAGGIPDYVTHVILSFGALNQMHLYTGLSKTDGDLLPVGLSLNTSSASLKESIRVLKQKNPGTKVLLALGGATYNHTWDNVSDADVNGLTKLMVDVGLDGLDVDYETGGTTPAIINEYYNSIVHMRKAVDQAQAQSGQPTILTLAGWSTGADCTVQTQGAAYPQCAGKVSYWGGNAGRERLVLQGKGASSMIDVISIMSYDADYQHYDPVTAYEEYRSLAKPDAVVAIGVQPAPDEGWGAAKTMVADVAGGACTGNLILQDQYGKPTPGTFSVERFAKVLQPKDGMMMWSLFASRPTASCGSSNLSTVTEIGQGVSQYLGIGSDRTTKIDYATAIAYGRR